MNNTILLLIIALTGFSVQVFSQWNFLGFSNTECSKVQVFENTMYLGTDQGMYMKSVQSTDTLWTPIGLQDRPVNDFIIFSQDTLLVATELFVYPEDSISLYITYDGGLNWLPYQNGFGGAYPRCNEIKHDPIQPNILFGVSGAAVARSTDKGLTWELIYSDWGMAAMFHVFLVDYNSGEIWVGGQTGYFENKIIKFTNYGDQYEIMDPVPNSTIACLLKHTEYPDHLLAGGGGGIFVSNNNGISWEQCEVTSGVTDMKLSPQNSNVVYATGFYDEGGSIPFFLNISNNFENSWNTVYYDDLTHDYFAHSLDVYAGPSYDNIYVATNRGVYVYKNTNLSRGEHFIDQDIRIFPNPAFDQAHIISASPVEQLKVFDISGREHCLGPVASSCQTCQIDIRSLTAGIYILRVDAANQSSYHKLIKK
jgi:hypothetical protein